jgi:hypothetical protein
VAFAYKIIVARRIKIKVSLPVGKWVNASTVRPEESNAYTRKSIGTHFGPQAGSTKWRNKQISHFGCGISTGNPCYEWTVSNQTVSMTTYVCKRDKNTKRVHHKKQIYSKSEMLHVSTSRRHLRSNVRRPIFALYLTGRGWSTSQEQLMTNITLHIVVIIIDHHDELWSVRRSACCLSLKVKPVLPSFPQASYASLPLWSTFQGLNKCYSDKCTLFLLFNTLLLKNVRHVSNQFMVHLQGHWRWTINWFETCRTFFNKSVLNNINSVHLSE